MPQQQKEWRICPYCTTDKSQIFFDPTGKPQIFPGKIIETTPLPHARAIFVAGQHMLTHFHPEKPYDRSLTKAVGAEYTYALRIDGTIK